MNFYEVPALWVIFLLFKIWKVVTGNGTVVSLAPGFRPFRGRFVGRVCFWVRSGRRWGRRREGPLVPGSPASLCNHLKSKRPSARDRPEWPRPARRPASQPACPAPGGLPPGAFLAGGIVRGGCGQERGRLPGLCPCPLLWMTLTQCFLFFSPKWI